MTLRRWFSLLALLALLALLVAACGGDDDDNGGVEPVSDEGATSGETTAPAGDDDAPSAPPTSDASPLADLPAQPAEVQRLPALPIAGTLIIRAGNAFHLARFDGEPAQQLAPTTPESLHHVSPDGRYLAYGSFAETPRPSQTEVVVIDVASGAVRSRTPLDRGLMSLVWAPEGQRLLIAGWRNEPAPGEVAIIIAPDGGDEQIVPLAASFVTTWTRAGTLVSGSAEARPPDLQPVEIDPATGAATPLDVAIQVQHPVFMYHGAEDQLIAAGVVIADFPTGNVTGILAGDVRAVIDAPLRSGGICDTWTVSGTDLSTGQMGTLYSVDDTAGLSDLQVLPDGSFSVLVWSKADCDFSQPMRGQIVRVAGDGTTEVLVEDINIARATWNAGVLIEGSRYAVAPDGRYVVWLHQVDAAAELAVELRIRDLDAGITRSLVALPSAAAPNSVLWVP